MLIKSTAILSVVGITELTRQGEVFIITFPAKSLFIYAMIAAIYFLYCYPPLRLANWLESGWPAACKAPASTRTDAAQHHAHRVRRHLLQAHAVRPATRYPALAGPESTEVCVVGGGLSVALELARRGRQVTLLEGSRIAWGASGRNGGSVSPAFSAGADAIRRHVDEEHYRALYRLSMEGGDHPRQHPRPGHPRRPQGRRPPARGALRRRRRAAALVR